MDALPKYDGSVKDGRKGLSEVIFKYLHYWKWFVISIVICLAIAVLYLKKSSPVYEVKAKILLENTVDNNVNSLQDLGLFNMKNNAENELEVLKTSYLMEKVVRKLGIYAQYFIIGTFRNTELYGASCPISIRLPEATLDTLRGRIDFEVEAQPNGTYVFIGIYNNKEYRIRAMASDSLVVLPFGPIYFNHGIMNPNQVMRVGVKLYNPSIMADVYSGSMDISLTSKTTTAVSLKLRITNLKKGIDLVNNFLETYKEEDIKDRYTMATNTSAYLDNLLSSLGDELIDVEKQVENFKQREGITNISSEAQLFIQRTGQYDQKRLEVGTQLGIIKDLESYINKNENRYQLLPSGIGIENVSLNGLIGEYNNLLLERKRLSRTATENNQIMIDLTDRIDALFKTVQSSVTNEKRNLMISQQDLILKDNENATRIRAIPRQEREITDLLRQQNIKSQLYLFLLQKRDENYLSKASVAPKFKIISNARSNGVPVAPKMEVIYVMALVFGLFLPVFGISVRDLFHNTVENREELKQISSIPILGEIPKSEASNNLFIRENSDDGFTEMYRLLRTNLMFVLNDPWKKVINVVSSIKGEGKTSVVINLALSLAFLGKKILIICLDVRRPMIDKILGLDNKIGVTQYLSGQIDHTKILRPSGIHSNLWVITSGPIPPNPNELLARSALDDLIKQNREQFDYIVIDTPPIGAVSDGLILNRFADVNLYVVRAEYTRRNNILDANEIFNDQKLNNVYIVLNATNMQKYYAYRYGRCRKHGYGYYSHDNQQTKK